MCCVHRHILKFYSESYLMSSNNFHTTTSAITERPPHRCVAASRPCPWTAGSLCVSVPKDHTTMNSLRQHGCMSCLQGTF